MRKILVVGGGPGGYVAAIRAAQLGAEVTLVEQDSLGGTCLNRGCIPTKALLHTASLLTEVQTGADWGVTVEGVALNFKQAQARKDAIVKKLVSGVTGLMRMNKITLVKGTASFADSRTLMVGDKVMPFDAVILATGSEAAMPPIPGIECPQCIESTGALALTEVPASMLIIGGGVIGVEMATIYRVLGSRVTVIEIQDEILPMMDKELAQIIRKKLTKQGVNIRTGAKVLSVANQGVCAGVQIEAGGESGKIEAEKVLVSVGRRVNTAALALNQAGIKHQNGRILVNDRQETNIPGVYAVGDCTGGVMLAHVASVQGEIAAENAMGRSAVYEGKTNPSCVYTNPEFAGVGLTEEEAKAQKMDYIVGRFPLMANGKAMIMGGTDGVVKIIAGKRHGEILGVHMVGPRATDLIAGAALAIGVEATLDEVIETIHAHPTVAEAVREAALAAYGRAIHIPNG